MTVFQGIRSEILQLETFQEHDDWRLLNLDEQIVLFNEFLNKNPNDERAWKLLGLAYFYMDSTDFLDDAILCLKKYLSYYSSPNNWAIYEVIGGCYALKGDYQFNVPCSNMDNWFLRSGRLNNPPQYAGVPNRVIGYVSQIREVAPGNRFNKLKSVNIERSKLHCNIPYSDISIENRMRAYKLYEEADSKYSGDKIMEAINLLDKAIQIDTNNALFYELRGLCYSSINPANFEIAVDNYKQALKIDPVESNFIMGMMRPMIELGRKSEALKYVQFAEKLGNPYAATTKIEILKMAQEEIKNTPQNHENDTIAKKPWWKF